MQTPASGSAPFRPFAFADAPDELTAAVHAGVAMSPG